MIQERLIELIQHPERVSGEDIAMLTDTVKKYPYMQSTRALRLLAVHTHDPENFESCLSETAAYTTDKKVLYYLVNQSAGTKKPDLAPSDPTEMLAAQTEVAAEAAEAREQELPVPNAAVLYEEKKKPEPVYIDGKLNRILFPGEEDLLQMPIQRIDIEQSKESGTLVLEKNVAPLQTEAIANSDQENITPSPAADVARAVSAVAEPSVESLSRESPEFKDYGNKEQTVADELPSESDASQEEERAEKQALPAAKDLKVVTVDEANNSEEWSGKTSFAQTEDFMPQVSVPLPAKVQHERRDQPQKTADEKSRRQQEEMQRLLAEVEEKMKKRKKSEQMTTTQEEAEEDTTALSDRLSFSEDMRPELTSLQQTDGKDNPAPVDLKVTAATETEIETGKTSSNVPQFVSTWQDWLFKNRNDRKMETNVASTKEVIEAADQADDTAIQTTDAPQQKISAEKDDVIARFIENEPKISPVRDDQPVMIRDKKADISHLMTETLANIYAEQKLYAKAIRGFQILSEKYPEKAAGYQTRIEEIRELRAKNQFPGQPSAE